MNKKGTSISGWLEAVLMIVLFIGVFGIIVSGVNEMYNKNFNVPISLGNTTDSLNSYTGSANEKVQKSNIITNVFGQTISEGFGLVRDALNILFNVLTGGFIEDLANMLGLGGAGIELAKIIRILFVLSLIIVAIMVIFNRSKV